MSTPVSVLMAVFNGERHVALAVASILAQTHRDLELIVIDDGSTDDTARILNRFADPRLRVVRQENRGLTCSLNRALKLATGTLIARQDADDLSIHVRLERQVRFLDLHPDVKLVGSSAFMSNPRGIIDEIFWYPVADEAIKRAMLILNPFVHGSVVADRALMEDFGGYNEEYRYVQDYELWSRVVPKRTVANLIEPLYARIRHRGTSEALVDKDGIFQSIRRRLLASHPEMALASTEAADHPIRTSSLWPLVACPRRCATLLATTLARCAAVERRHGLPWLSTWFASLLYCPWRRT